MFYYSSCGGSFIFISCFYCKVAKWIRVARWITQSSNQHEIGCMNLHCEVIAMFRIAPNSVGSTFSSAIVLQVEPWVPNINTNAETMRRMCVCALASVHQRTGLKGESSSREFHVIDDLVIILQLKPLFNMQGRGIYLAWFQRTYRVLALYPFKNVLTKWSWILQKIVFFLQSCSSLKWTKLDLLA
jgi:hypothetical protein